MTTLIKTPSVAFMLPIHVSNVNMSVTKGGSNVQQEGGENREKLAHKQLLLPT
jgi:hypothetical protein